MLSTFHFRNRKYWQSTQHETDASCPQPLPCLTLSHQMQVVIVHGLAQSCKQAEAEPKKAEPTQAMVMALSSLWLRLGVWKAISHGLGCSFWWLQVSCRHTKKNLRKLLIPIWTFPISSYTVHMFTCVLLIHQQYFNVQIANCACSLICCSKEGPNDSSQHLLSCK